MAILSPLLRLFLVSYTYYAWAAPPATGSIDVVLKTGIFRGISSPSNGTDKFLGIPFAVPPVGNLRFKSPVAITKKSSAVQDATKFSNACPQPADSGLNALVAEDCLHLNVSISSIWVFFLADQMYRYGGQQIWKVARKSLFCSGYMCVFVLSYTISWLTFVLLKGGAYTTG